MQNRSDLRCRRSAATPYTGATGGRLVPAIPASCGEPVGEAMRLTAGGGLLDHLDLDPVTPELYGGGRRVVMSSAWAMSASAIATACRLGPLLVGSARSEQVRLPATSARSASWASSWTTPTSVSSSGASTLLTRGCSADGRPASGANSAQTRAPWGRSSMPQDRASAATMRSPRPVIERGSRARAVAATVAARAASSTRSARALPVSRSGANRRTAGTFDVSDTERTRVVAGAPGLAPHPAPGW
jgi:hypothetical protein